MRDRIITAAVIIAVLGLIAFVDNQLLTLLFLSVVSFLALKESMDLFKLEFENKILYITIATLFISLFNPFLASVFGVIVILSYIAFKQQSLNLVSPFLYPLLPLMLLGGLYVKHGMGVIGWLIITVAVTDSAAYLIGKNFGKQFFKFGFSPTSPNKSWEGVIGGVLAGSIIGSFAGLYFMGFSKAFLITLILSLSSVFGDLFESYLKRKAGVKDSGNILPGHGGVLDRVDGYLFAAPVMLVLLGL